jgi:hypothetical protein
VSSVPAESGWARNYSGAIGNLTLAQTAAANANELKYAQCMRAHKVSNFPDPNGQGTNSPQFQSAWQACQSNLSRNLQGQQP